MSRVLVTGGAGFIGSHVVEQFVAEGYGVSVIDDLSTGNRRNLTSGVELHAVDVGSREAAALVSSGEFDIVAHLAAQIDVRKSVADPIADARINILGTLNLLEAARTLPVERRPRIIFASTGGALYGDESVLPSTERTEANPDAPYGVAKLSVELYLAYYARIWQMPTVILRFGNVYGPRQDPKGEAGVIAIFAQRIASGLPITVYGDGGQTRDFIFVKDVATAFFAAANCTLPVPRSVDARAFNIGTGVETSVIDLAKALAQAAGVAPQIEFAPARSGEVQRSLLSVEKAERVLKWKPRVDLASGLEITYKWAVQVG